MYRRIAIAVAVGALVAGCAPAGPQGALPPDDPTYTTGSHLPKRSGGGGASTIESTAPTPDQMNRAPVYVPKAGQQ
jgi:hypothetical protein